VAAAAGAVAFTLGAGATGSTPAASFPIRFGAGLQVEVFSESYGQGDLFSDLEETPILEPSPEDERLRIRRDVTLPGVYLEAGWEEPQSLDRRAEVTYEQDEESATASFDGSWRGDAGDGWEVRAEGRARAQYGLGEDRSRDLLGDLVLAAKHAVGGLGDVSVELSQEYSGVTGDSLSRLFDYSLWSAGVRVERPVREASFTTRAQWSYRNSPDEFAGDYRRFRLRSEISRFSLSGWEYDVAVEGTRRDYVPGGVVDPSNVEGELSAMLAHPIGGPWRLGVDGEFAGSFFDHPDEAYFDYLTGEIEGSAAWMGPSGVSAELGAGGEWLRPQTTASGAYDQSRLRATVSWFGPKEIWVDVEDAVGHRNYLGDGGDLGLLTGEGSFDFEASDFVYNELSILCGFTWGLLTSDVYAQYTIEDHRREDEDVSFFLLNLRVGTRF
jgi:hypothetical protein